MTAIQDQAGSILVAEGAALDLHTPPDHVPEHGVPLRLKWDTVQAVGLTREEVEAICPQAAAWSLPEGLPEAFVALEKGPDDDYPLDGLRDLDA
jgi:hypothetical protein